jgi:hypothetical protein
MTTKVIKDLPVEQQLLDFYISKALRYGHLASRCRKNDQPDGVEHFAKISRKYMIKARTLSEGLRKA